jgi:transposase
MNEALRHEIVQRRQAGTPVRAIARELAISRGSVIRVLARVQAQRAGQAAPAPRPRPSIVDPFEPILKELLAQYPNLTNERAWQELRARGFRGGYTVVRQRLGRLRPRAAPTPVPRFETGPGRQAQMDFGVYDLDFTREGRRRVYLFSYVLGYSRRHYLHFVEAMDLPTTLREHVHAFHHLGGAAHVCLYDNFKAVVLRHDADGVIYHPKFLAFATHYGFRPQACRVRRPQTKGKVEREFHYVETSLLNARTFDTLAHLNEVTAWWLQNVADVRTLRDFKETPLQRHAREQAQLLTLPTCDFDTAQVVYRLSAFALTRGLRR